MEPRDTLLMQASTKTWLDFMNIRPMGIDPVIEAFIKATPKALNQGSPRQWGALSELIQSQNDGFAPWSVEEELVAHFIGHDLSKQFLDFAVAQGYMDQARREVDKPQTKLLHRPLEISRD